ncbi:MAG: tRNA1(Val) (adenine(37)-N6)-methyltransferase [Kaistella sp.]
MKPFQFKNFSLNQSAKVFRVGTDGVLLGASVCVQSAENILEIGTGTGLIALMIAQRNTTAKITALDINEEAVTLADENFRNSPYKSRLRVLHCDFKNFESDEKFDLIVSNPPYFEENPSEKDVMARQQTELSFRDLIKNASGNLSPAGRLSVIIPFASGDNFEEICIENQLFLTKRITIFGIKNSAPKRLILEFATEKKTSTESKFVIEKSPRTYSDQYLELTKDFHVFGK